MSKQNQPPKPTISSALNQCLLPALDHRQLQLLMTQVVTVLEDLRDGLQTASSGSEETKEGLARRQHTRQVLGVELHADIPLVVLELDDLHALAGLVLPDEREPTGLELLDERRVDLVAVAVTFPDLVLLAVQLS